MEDRLSLLKRADVAEDLSHDLERDADVLPDAFTVVCIRADRDDLAAELAEALQIGEGGEGLADGNDAARIDLHADALRDEDLHDLVKEVGKFLVVKRPLRRTLRGLADVVDVPENVEALQLWLDLQNKYQVMNPGIVQWTDMPTQFLAGEIAMMYHTTGNLTNIKNNATFDFGVAFLPAGKQWVFCPSPVPAT